MNAQISLIKQDLMTNRNIQFQSMSAKNNRNRCGLALILSLILSTAMYDCSSKPEKHYMEMAKILCGEISGSSEENVNRCRKSFENLSSSEVKAIPALIYLLKNDDLKIDAGYWITRFGMEAIPSLYEELETVARDEKPRIIRVIGDTAGSEKQVQEKLISLLSDKDFRVAITAQETLRRSARIHKQVSDDVYLEILKNHKKEYRLKCMFELYMNGRYEMTEKALLEDLQSGDLDRISIWIFRLDQELVKSAKIRKAICQLLLCNLNNKSFAITEIKKTYEDYLIKHGKKADTE